MAFFSKLKDRLFKSSSKLEKGLDAIVEDGGEEEVLPPIPETAAPVPPPQAEPQPEPEPEVEPIPVAEVQSEEPAPKPAPPAPPNRLPKRRLHRLRRQHMFQRHPLNRRKPQTSPQKGFWGACSPAPRPKPLSAAHWMTTCSSNSKNC